MPGRSGDAFMMWHLETFTARLDGVHARPVAAMLLAGSLMGFVLGQEAGHTHMQRQPHMTRPPVGAVATHAPVKPTPTKVPTISHVVNPVVSYQPPAAKPTEDGGGHGDGGGDHGGGQGGHHHGNGQGGYGGHGGHGHGSAKTATH